MNTYFKRLHDFNNFTKHRKSPAISYRTNKFKFTTPSQVGRDEHAEPAQGSGGNAAGYLRMPPNLLRHLASRMHEQELGGDVPLDPPPSHIVVLAAASVRIVLLDAQIVDVSTVVVAHCDHALIRGVPLQRRYGRAMRLEPRQGLRRRRRIGRLKVTQVPHGEGSCVV